MNSSISTTIINTKKPFSLLNKFRPIKIIVNDKKENLKELPFGWGEGEPPTPDDEIEYIEPSTNSTDN